ncbi:fungal hydrophobin domain-containing protein [Trichoderma breve]|uniref:Fungal hydrophobin domain-containing protein n=1 Tax=Trichoderma breve TaxID=2034170 RepID=A0A9W9EF01_9HYPO|nr:fungal hydrophobin domain-containing protein [Trichoderma breve]KAJ4865444.1 fungal hydrophobin domain-containing protein [Trichoderma breve]
MKLLTITALFVAGALAVPASSYPPPPPPDYGDGGDNGGYSPVPSSSGDGYGYVPPTPTPPLPPPPPSYDDGGDYEPPTDGDGDSSDGGDDGDDSDDSGDDSDGERSGSNICPNVLYGVAQCCDTVVAGLLGLGCDNPHQEPHSMQDLKSICKEEGQKGACCTVKLLGLAVLCEG